MPRQNHLHISIPEPCTMKWEEMEHVDEQSRHCSSCEKVVLDFTRMSDDELIAFFQKTNNVCGRFLPHQIGKDLVQYHGTRHGNFFRKLVLFNSFLFGLLIAVKAEPSVRKNSVTVERSEQERGIIPITEPKIIAISGTVKDSISQGPLWGLLVDLNYGNDTLHCFTDENGNYSFRVKLISGPDSIRVVVDENYYDKFEKSVQINGITEIKVDAELIKKKNQPQVIRQYAIAGAAISVCHYKPRPIHAFFYRLFHPRSW
ncbi:MAG: carboxypeptidase-like regulatory domain-containing protein [Bacteroidota bacterium]|nr:carboxypeptidase-like regulatory domain-containing protein [Bacteroidota bacterium]